jgi:hypothetical protein
MVRSFGKILPSSTWGMITVGKPALRVYVARAVGTGKSTIAIRKMGCTSSISKNQPEYDAFAAILSAIGHSSSVTLLVLTNCCCGSYTLLKSITMCVYFMMLRLHADTLPQLWNASTVMSRPHRVWTHRMDQMILLPTVHGHARERTNLPMFSEVVTSLCYAALGSLRSFTVNNPRTIAGELNLACPVLITVQYAYSI